MGAVVKPLHVNPVRLSQPMGATLAFLGIDRCMPLMHGAQGCASFTKVFLTRHYCDPIVIQTTAVTDISAILDGGGAIIEEAVKNITAKVTPKLIGLFSTGLTETKGDDIAGAAKQISLPCVHVNTPDFEGGLESGWAKAVSAMISQLTISTTSTCKRKVAILPHVGISALELERIKQMVRLFELEPVVLPDISLSLDGHLGQKQTALSSGGTDLEEIIHLGSVQGCISIGASMRECAKTLLEKNPKIVHHHFMHLSGLEATDAFVKLLLDFSGKEAPDECKRWRARLQDALLDTHEILGSKRIALIGESDEVAHYGALLQEAGAKLDLVIGANPSENLEILGGFVGDFEDLEKQIKSIDLVIGNSHALNIASKFNIPWIPRGFPQWHRVGAPMRQAILYEGGCMSLFEIANALSH
jgi:nitrogenase molybdenum-iron protein NifN